jgi:ribosomal protein L12E/L44/L45/RPP1/RPP2
LVAASGVKVEAYWPKLFAKALSGRDISSYFNFAGAASGPAPAATSAPAAAEKKGEKKE